MNFLLPIHRILLEEANMQIGEGPRIRNHDLFKVEGTRGGWHLAFRRGRKRRPRPKSVNLVFLAP